MNKQYLENYATLIIEMGVQIRPGQKLLITADVRDHEFVELEPCQSEDIGISAR